MLALALDWFPIRKKALSTEIIRLDVVDQFSGFTNEMQPCGFSGETSFNTCGSFVFLKND